MKKRTKQKGYHKPDKVLLVTVFIIIGVGLIMLSSASVVVSQEHYGNSYGYFFHQLIYGVGIGLIVFLFCKKINYQIWQKISLLIFLVVIGLLILVFVPELSVSHGGASRWIDLKVFSFQPSEIAKLGIIIFLSAWLAKPKDQATSFFKTTIPFIGIMVLIASLLIPQPDLSTLIVILSTSFILFFLSGIKFNQVILVGLLGIVGIFGLIKFAPYRMSRLITFMNPDLDPLGTGYQIKQSLLAIGSGGIFGVGLGHSRQKYNYLPSPASDSIFAIGAEELGFLGATVLIALFIILAIRGLKIAKYSPNKFSYLTAAGISSWFVVQAFINIAAIINLIPLTGITLPFISYGSSSLISCLAGAGILINISKYTKL